MQRPSAFCRKTTEADSANTVCGTKNSVMGDLKHLFVKNEMACRKKKTTQSPSGRPWHQRC